MADPTAELLVKVGTDTKQLKTGLDAAGKRVGGFANTIRKHHRAIGVAMAAMGAAILATAALSVKQYASMGDAVQKMALRTGFSTEALSELRHAAELSGASLAGLEKASRTLSGAILDAGYGLETYVRSFDQLGLSYENLAALSPEDQFMAVMEALAKVENESTRAALATDLFGRAGTQLLPMLSSGAEGLAEMRQEAHDLGIVFDQEAANKAAAFNDALTKLKGAVSGIMMQIASALVPVLKDFVDWIKEIVVGLGKWAEEHKTLTKVLVFLTTALGGLLVTVAPIIIMLDSLIDIWMALKVVWASHVIPTIGKLIAVIGLKMKALYASKIATLLHIPAIWGLVTALWAQVTATLAAMSATGVLIPAAIAAVAAIALLATGITLLVKNQKEQYESTSAVAEVTTTTAGVMETYTEELDDTTDATKKLRKESEKLADSLRGTVAAAFMTYATMATLTPFQIEQQAALGGLLGIHGRPRWDVPEELREEEPGRPTEFTRGAHPPGITINFTEPVFMEREESMNKLADKIYRVIKKEQRLSFGVARG